MKALILAGGLGTRLRPLTFSMPKPVIPLLGRPLVRHLIDPLPEEVDTVILAVSYMKDYLERYFRENDIGREVVLVNEEEPLGTGGAIKNVARWLDDTFFAFNGDIISSLDLSAMLESHRSHHGIGTIALWSVDDPSAFGVVATDGSGRVTTFQEKPAPGEEVSNRINAGAYIFEPELLDRIPDGVVSLERDVFPNVLDRGLYGYAFQGYWVDDGTRESFRRAQRTLLDVGGGRVACAVRRLSGVRISGNNMIEAAHVEPSAIGPNVYIERGAQVHDGATISNSMVMAGAVIGRGATISNSIIGPGMVVEDGAVIADVILA